MDPKQQSQVHEDALELLPWYVNGTLEGGELVHVERHLKTCLTCRREVDSLKCLAQAIAESDDLQLSPQRAFSRLLNKIDAGEKTSDHRWQSLGKPFQCLRRLVQSSPPLVKGMLYAQLALLLLVVVLLAETLPWTQTRVYHTLSDSGEVHGGWHIQIALTENANREQVRSVLETLNARIVEPPIDSNTYTIEIPSSPDLLLDLTQALERLRGHPSVQSAQPTYAGITTDGTGA